MEQGDASKRPSSSSNLRLELLSKALVPALERFHQRLEVAGGPPYRFGTHVPEDATAAPPMLETWVVVEGEEVRGGVMLQRLEVDGEGGRHSAANIQLPLSEGTINKTFAHIGPWLIRRLLKFEPRLYAVGMGGMDQPLPRLLSAMGWSVDAVPFFFYMHRPNRVLGQLPVFSASPLRRIASTMLRLSGGGWLGARAAAAIGSRAGMSATRGLKVVRLDDWGEWVNVFWEQTRMQNSLGAVRDASALGRLYPVSAERTGCYRVQRGADTVGWFVVSRRQMQDSAHFGNLHVGTILDAQALPGLEVRVVRCARRELKRLGVDLSLANFTHVDWQRACRRAGYFPGPSNYVFAGSPKLMQCAPSATVSMERIHFTRGDGDGRLHL